MNEFKQPGAEGGSIKEDSDPKVSESNSVHSVSEGNMDMDSCLTSQNQRTTLCLCLLLSIIGNGQFYRFMFMYKNLLIGVI